MKTSNAGTAPFQGLASRTNIAYALTLVALAAGFILAIISWLHICSEACSEGHNYRLFGHTFESIGIPFFGMLTLAQLFSYKNPPLKTFVAVLLSMAIGAELMFTYAQKAIIGHWCPVCLCIAASVLVAFLTVAYEHITETFNSLKDRRKGDVMKRFFNGGFCLALAVFGFVFSQAGFAKYDQLQAEEKSIKESIAFGDMGSHVEVYVFTDWECPSCRKVEPILEKASPAIMKKAKLVFVDMPVHPESTNFTPYNLSFMINDKAEYFHLRDQLTKLSLTTKTPTDEQVEAIAKKSGAKYRQLHYADIDVGIKYFKHLSDQFKVEGTPTVVIVNAEKKKGKRLVGVNEITEENILKAIDALSQ